MSSESTLLAKKDRQGFWYSALIGIFLGYLMGSGFTSILGIVRAHRHYEASQGVSKTDGSGFALRRGPLAPDIQGFVNQNGKPVTTADLLGKVRVITFLSPLGDRYSPLVVSNLMNLYQELGNNGLLGKDVVFVSYNVDPSHTGPAVMSEFMEHIAGLGPDTSSWLFLTAKPAVVRQLVSHGYGIHYRQLSVAGYKNYIARQRQEGNYLFATANNPLTGQYHPDYHIVGHDEIMIVGPRDHIWMRIHNASSYGDGELMRNIATLLKLPGMTAQNG